MTRGQVAFVFMFLVANLAAGCNAPQVPPADVEIRLAKLWDGLDAPTFVTEAPNFGLLIVEQEGVIRQASDSGVLDGPFLDLRDRIGNGGERGLLGLAFDPDFGENGRFFVHYTDRDGDSVLSRFTMAEGQADKGSERVLLQVDQPYANHNGGMIVFGPDGFLYMGLGDGGSGGDPHENGQKLSTLLGKILRLDVSGDAYSSPGTNPFRGSGERREIWAYGLRNPWRFSFDSATGDLFIGDVGQNEWEEIDFQPASSRGGENYGWNRFEGSHPFRSGSGIDHTPPIAEYPTGPGGTCAVTGGYVYRGKALEGLQGQYVFADYCSGTIWSLVRRGGDWTRRELLDTNLRISSFGEALNGEVYVVDHGGTVYVIQAA